MIVDCKCLFKKIDVKDVETFIGLVEDVNAEFGLLITTSGIHWRRQDAPLQSEGSFSTWSRWTRPAVWRPRRPSVAWTAGAGTATLTYVDADGLRTLLNLVSPEIPA